MRPGAFLGDQRRGIKVKERERECVFVCPGRTLVLAGEIVSLSFCLVLSCNIILIAYRRESAQLKLG